MKLFTLTIALFLATSMLHSASAFQVRAFGLQQRQSQAEAATSSSLGMSSYHITSDVSELGENRGESILSALGTMEGPSICYGHFAALESKRELDIKEYDNFDNFKNAIDQAECTQILRGNGPFTVFAPTNSAIEKFPGILTQEVILSHIIAGDLFSDELTGEFETLSGHKVVCKNQFRKLYVNEALIGQLDNHTGGTPYPTNTICDNGVIHAINVVLTPGYTPTVADSQGVQGLSLQSHLNQDVLKARGALPDDATSQH